MELAKREPDCESCAGRSWECLKLEFQQGADCRWAGRGNAEGLELEKWSCFGVSDQVGIRIFTGSGFLGRNPLSGEFIRPIYSQLRIINIVSFEATLTESKLLRIHKLKLETTDSLRFHSSN
jgi:hypothetical protein